MSESMIYILITIFLIVSAGLFFYISLQIKDLLTKKKQREESARKQQAANEKHKQYLIESIRVISSSMLDNQCPLTEGCIRLKVLLDNYSSTLKGSPELIVLERVYEKTTHIPILDEWKKLSLKDRVRFEKEIATLEKNHDAEIKEAARFLKAYPFEERGN